MSPKRKPARRTILVRLDGRNVRLWLSEIRPRGRRPRPRTADFFTRASSPYWFWALERPLADAIGDALLELGAARGAKDGHTLVQLLRDRTA